MKVMIKKIHCGSFDCEYVGGGVNCDIWCKFDLGIILIIILGENQI
jgi:hypothetical protein